MTIVCHGWSLRGFPFVAPNLFAAHAHANFTWVGPANVQQLSDTPPTGSSFAISATGGRHSETLARTASSTLCPDGRTPKAAQAPPSITVLPSTNTLNSPYFPFSIRLRCAVRDESAPPPGRRVGRRLNMRSSGRRSEPSSPPAPILAARVVGVNLALGLRNAVLVNKPTLSWLDWLSASGAYDGLRSCKEHRGLRRRAYQNEFRSLEIKNSGTRDRVNATRVGSACVLWQCRGRWDTYKAFQVRDTRPIQATPDRGADAVDPGAPGRPSHHHDSICRAVLPSGRRKLTKRTAGSLDTNTRGWVIA